ncbi:hypothetical protein GCM10007304_01300 [Rhodococcoides trifolii]|uniref:Uncharacterized protein n=1 Tax=Rhodococcoides trifolii TaxID=908250 RepID=A0A917FLK6_9NOCA|nr:hypothetical protein GCM10007304_01300 [Rhodococcus trifolii]
MVPGWRVVLGPTVVLGQAVVLGPGVVPGQAVVLPPKPREQTTREHPTPPGRRETPVPAMLQIWRAIRLRQQELQRQSEPRQAGSPTVGLLVVAAPGVGLRVVAAPGAVAVLQAGGEQAREVQMREVQPREASPGEG